MRRVLALLVVAALAGCSASEAPEPAPEPLAPPPPPPPPTEGSFEVSPGDAWRYAGENATSLSTILAVANGTVTMRTTTLRAGEAPHNVTTRLDARTMAIVAVMDDRMGVEMRFEPPLSILVPARDHEHRGNVTATTFLGDVRQPVRGEVSYLGPANVTVPAGEFYAYGYRATLRSDGLFPLNQTREIWFAPEVQQAVRASTDGREEALVAYERAGQGAE